MATASISFPTTETLLGPELARAASPPKISVKHPSKKPTIKKYIIPTRHLNGVAKPKQTKSRNGCATCKDKRLKCDETKPRCEQCKKRDVVCGGYNKIFQWRPEEKATFRANPTSKGRKRECCPPVHAVRMPMGSESTTAHDSNPLPSSLAIPDVSDCTRGEPCDYSIPTEARSLSLYTRLDEGGFPFANSWLNFNCPNIAPSQYEMGHMYGGRKIFACAGTSPGNEDSFDHNFDPETASTETSNVSFDEHIPFDNLLFSFENSDAPMHLPRSSSHSYQKLATFDLQVFPKDVNDDAEEVTEEHGTIQPWAMRPSSPSLSDSSWSSSPSSNGTLVDLSTRYRAPTQYREPVLSPFSPEMLIAQFTSSTCGILSIKDGLGENPWRTMLLPMASGVPALHHSILSLSAFHASRQNKTFRIVGLKHMQKSIHCFRQSISTMRRDTALATTLVLAFCESWEQEISTGIQHLKAARKLVTQAVANQEGNAECKEIERLKFLRNTWVYMDVIARITAVDTGDWENLDALFAPVCGPQALNEELDPLMGCATSLFPIIGRVANLVHDIRKTARNLPRTVSRAAGLKAELQRWRAPDYVQKPEDDTIEITHSLRTAEAYRWAALLFLFQAVPMVANELPAVLAEKILCELVSVPLSSRVIIIQIFPLLAAGCEIMDEDNRSLVEERWSFMTNRMTIGNLDRCCDVVHEVWRRRDEAARKMEDADHRSMTDYNGDSIQLCNPLSRRNTLSPTTMRPTIVRPDQLHQQQFPETTCFIDEKLTVRGHCHWLTVMEDWDWAILLG